MLASVTCTGQRSVTPSAPAAQNSSPGVISVTRQSAWRKRRFQQHVRPQRLALQFPCRVGEKDVRSKRQFDFCHAVLPCRRTGSPCQYPAVRYGGGGFPPGRLRRLAERLDIEDALHFPRLPPGFSSASRQ